MGEIRNCRLRPAQPEDEAAVHRLARMLGYADVPGECGASFKQILGSAEQEILVADCDGGIVGWVHVFIARRPGLPSFAEIGGMIMDEANRRQGTGKQLLDQCENWARAQNQKMIRVRCNVDREVAHRFYDAAGYLGTKQQTVFDKLLERGDIVEP